MILKYIFKIKINLIETKIIRIFSFRWNSKKKGQKPKPCFWRKRIAHHATGRPFNNNCHFFSVTIKMINKNILFNSSFDMEKSTSETRILY